MNKFSTQSGSERGAALLIFLIFFLIASMGLVFVLSRGVYTDASTYRWLQESKQTFFTTDALTEDIAYRLISGLSPQTTETATYAGVSATSTLLTNLVTEQFTVRSVGALNDTYRRSKLVMQIGGGASFNFGVQTGNGGFSMANSAQVIGNVFSNGNVLGGGSSQIRGDVIAAGPAGFVDGIHATGSVWSHTIESGLIEGNAYYFSTSTINLSNTTVWGDLYPGSPDEATSTLPIPDDVVAAHQASTTEAIANGVGTLITATDPECSSGIYTIDASVTFAQPTKIECDVLVTKNSTTLTLRDTFWVAGNLTFSQGPTVVADPATSTNSVLIIVDNPSNRTSSSKVVVNNGTVFLAGTSPKSYVVLLTMNESAELGGIETAINMGQSSNGDIILYAGHGKVQMANQISLKEVTAYLITMGNNTVIEYESGLVNLNFTSGPGGGFDIISWSEE